MKAKILVIGQYPPPYHGSNVMAKIMMDALEEKKYRTIFIDKKFSMNAGEIGKPSIRKILRVPILIVKIIFICIIKSPNVCVFFMSCGKYAFLLDSIFLFSMRLCGIPYILRFGGKGYKALRNSGTIWHNLVVFVFRNALGGIVKGEILKSDVNCDIPDERLLIVPNTTMLRKIKYNKKNDKNHIQILFLSNFDASKGATEVLKAAKIVVRQNKNVRFVLAGAEKSKIYKKQLTSYILKNKLTEFVQMIGVVKGDIKEKLLASTDIFVFPTQYKYETFGIVNIEAMQYGIPIITSAEGAIPEIVQNGITGYIINPKCPDEIADKIMKLYNNPDLRKKMGSNGRKVFNEKYCFEAYAAVLDDTIRKFLDQIINKNKLKISIECLSTIGLLLNRNSERI